MPRQNASTATREQGSSAAVGSRTSLRALAHPLRWQLIDLLDSTGQATATQCAEALGETVASCAYHLSILGKYGYARQVAGHKGRDKPWELTETAEWQEGTGVLDETTWLTAAELNTTWAAIKDLVLKFADRDRDPSRRPEGAREARLFAASSVAPQRAAVGSSPAAPGS
jgi:hypothetical protein